MGKKFWFPLALLGFTLIGLALVPPGDDRWFAYVSPSSSPGGTSASTASVTASIVGDFHVRVTRAEYWPYLIAAIFVATVAWYAVRAEKPRPWRRLAAITVSGLIAIPIAGIVADGMTSHGDGRELLGTVMGLFALLGAGGAAWAYFRLGPGRGAAIIIAVMFGPLAVYAWLVALVPQTAEALLPGLGLLALAWFERSVLLAAITLAFLLAVIVFTTGLAALLVPAAVMLAGAIATLLTHRPPSADTA
jgi:hypothetical protein